LKCGGLFRLSAGNPKLIERLRASFDRTGDADLEAAGDVATAASLLKLWLRELPEPIISSHVAIQLLDIHESKYFDDSLICVFLYYFELGNLIFSSIII
jgi:RhoGAP domain.